MGDGVQLADLASGENLVFLKLSQQDFVSVAFESSGALLTNGTADGVWRWPIHADTAAPGQLKIGPPQKLPLPGTAGEIVVSGDGGVIANAQFHGGACVFRGARPDQLIWLRPHADVRELATSADGSRVATAGFDGAGVKIWDSANGKLLKELLPEDYHLSVKFSSNGKWLATGGPCRLWDVDTWRDRRQINGDAFSFAPDSSLLAVETGAGAVRLVDPETGREHVRIEDPHQERARSMAFSSDGTYLLTNTDEPSVHIWDLRTVRRQLAVLDLDWDLPSYAPMTEPRNAPRWRVTVNRGAFGTDPAKSVGNAP